MLKLVLLIASATVIGVLLLELRQQRLEMNYQTNTLYDQIEQCQAKLWNQQLQIAIETAPNAIAKTVGQRAMNLVRPLPPGGRAEDADGDESAAAE